MRKLLILVMLSLAAAADPLKVVSLQWTQLKGKDGDKLTGHLSLSAPAPAGGVNLVIEPTFNLELPMTVKVPAGQTGVDIPVKIVDYRLFHRDESAKTSVTIVLGGEEFEFPGPLVNEASANPAQ